MYRVKQTGGDMILVDFLTHNIKLLETMGDSLCREMAACAEEPDL